MTNLVSETQPGLVYLVRRKLNGSLTTRFQPAEVLDRKVEPGRTTLLKVRWLTDNVEQDGVIEIFGSVKELSHKWLRDEYARAVVEADAARVRVENLNALFFKQYGVSDLAS